MKKILSYILVFLPILSQAQWTRIAAPAASILSVDFISNHGVNYGFAVGSGGTCIRSDSGNIFHWRRHPLPTERQLTVVQFVDSLRGFIGGVNGLILRTTNSGKSWQVVMDEQINSINFIYKTSQGILAISSSGKVFRSQDGGQSFSFFNSIATGFINDARFFNEQVGIVGGYPSIIKRTTDGGFTWTSISSLSAFSSISSIASWDGSSILVSGQGSNNIRAFRSNDLGETFQPISTTQINSSNVLRYIDSQTIVTELATGSYRFSTDHGTTWQYKSFFGGNTGTSTYFAQNNCKKINNFLFSCQSRFLSLDLQNQEYKGLYTPQLGNVGPKFLASNDRNLMVPNYSEFFTCWERGKDTSRYIPIPGKFGQINDVIWLDSNQFLISRTPSSGSSVMSWFKLNLQSMQTDSLVFPPSNAPGSIRLSKVSDSLIYGIRSDRSLILTTNNGVTWKNLNHLSSQNNPIMVGPKNWFLLTGGTLFRSNDTGKIWQELYYGTVAPPLKVYYFNEQLIFLSTSNYLIRSSNGGDSWSMVSTIVPNSNIGFTSPEKGFIIGPNILYSTLDSGKTWQSIPYPFDYPVYNLFEDRKTKSLYAHTQYGNFYFTSETINPPVVSNLKIQNYNPFSAFPNPSEEEVFISKMDLTLALGLEIFNTKGLKIPVRLSSRGSLEIKSLPKGIYILKGVFEGQPFSIRFLKL